MITKLKQVHRPALYFIVQFKQQRLVNL